MRSFIVEAVIENKPLAKDPEGETVYRDLITKSGYEAVRGVRSGKYLRLTVEAKDADEARDLVSKMFNDLRIFNPVVHSCRITVRMNVE